MEACSYQLPSMQPGLAAVFQTHTSSYIHAHIHGYPANVEMSQYNILTSSYPHVGSRWASTIKMLTQQNFSCKKSKLISELLMVFLKIHINTSSNETIQVALSSSRLPPVISKSKVNLLSQRCEPGLDSSHDSCVPEHWLVWEYRGSAAWADAKSMFDSERMPIVKLKRVAVVKGL